MCGNEKSVFLQPQKRETLFERQTQSQADIAQLVEQLMCNQPVGGSSPSIGSNGRVPERSNGADCKSVGEAFGGSNPPPPTSHCGSSSFGRATAFQAVGSGFETRLPLTFAIKKRRPVLAVFFLFYAVASSRHGVDEAVFHPHTYMLHSTLTCGTPHLRAGLLE